MRWLKSGSNGLHFFHNFLYVICLFYQEEIIKKKYGGLLPKKASLISKDHEHAFFDSADWALGKQGAQKSKGPLEALRPKLQPTPHDQVRSRRTAYARTEDGKDGSIHDDTNPKEDQSTILDKTTDCSDCCEDHNCQS
ncbi:Hypothetical predicted protein [Olea europaea subsp. europaea]|uniref:Endosulphine n=1 Tax=Olea europaea subsp. europaea TaxID=158383 RepID=A0A8S0QX89_OLEEU|nr:Hypothetical predicted protein [Olea europaea subsp. europaea]